MVKTVGALGKTDYEEFTIW